MNALISQLKKYANDNNLSNKKLALKINVPSSTIDKWFTEKKSNREPSKNNLFKIQNFLNTAPQVSLNMNEVDSHPVLTNKPSDVTTTREMKMSSNLIKRSKVIRDPVQMDIELEPIEISIIDTIDFQRLRNIKQLGTASLVYPGATHTRFEHSLGTLAVAKRMIDAVNANPDSQEKIPPDIVKLIRMCALLHDITHVPFGHTLEDEGFLYMRHDNDRWERFLGAGSEIGDKLAKNESEYFRKQVITYLGAKEEQVNSLEHPYVADIVGNTVCADLIDYLARDVHYSGLNETFDPRFLRYLVIASYNNGGKTYNSRLVLSLIQNNRIRRDVISEVMEVLSIGV